jgi:hypothetical protein
MRPLPEMGLAEKKILKNLDASKVNARIKTAKPPVMIGRLLFSFIEFDECHLTKVTFPISRDLFTSEPYIQTFVSKAT